MTDTAAEEAFRALLERAVNQATNRTAVAMIADGFRRIPDDADAWVATLGHVSMPPGHNVRSAECVNHPAYMVKWAESCPACSGASPWCAADGEKWPCRFSAHARIILQALKEAS